MKDKACSRCPYSAICLPLGYSGLLPALMRVTEAAVNCSLTAGFNLTVYLEAKAKIPVRCKHRVGLWESEK